MGQKRFTRRSFLKSSILTAGAVVINANTPPGARFPAPGSTVMQPDGLNLDMTSAAMVAATPRNETLYFNGQQWGSVVGWNPYSSGMNNSLAIGQQDNARVTVFETPYVYNMLTGEQFPLLADGPWAWNADMTAITFKIKAAAKWSDGTPVTAADVAYTWDSNVKYGSVPGNNFKDYIDTITAADDQTVVVKAKLDEEGKAVYPLQVLSYLSYAYVIQKAWTQILEGRIGGDAAKFLNDPADDVVYSGPYHKYFVDDSKVVLVRDDNYWGQDASLWGKLPAPKYLAHVIYTNNNIGLLALKAAEVDVSQQYNANVQDLWLKNKLPISTYLPTAPYNIGASLPTAFYNLGSYGLDQVAVRKAIAMAVDYNTIIANAMTNQSATFAQVPRSLMNPSAGEQAKYDQSAVADLQWVGNDIAGAKKLLDDAGIKDSNHDGWREYNGKKLSYVATCPNGWSDWQAAINMVAAAGKKIGIQITTKFPDWGVYQYTITNWPLPAGYDIFMMYNDGAGPAEPWNRTNHLLNSKYGQTQNNWNGNWGGYQNPDADALINAIPAETDPAKQKADYTELTRIYLTDVPSFTLMYRPQSFHTVNASVWTGYPHQGDGTNPPVPPLDLTDGYSIAGLYNITLLKAAYPITLLQPLNGTFLPGLAATFSWDAAPASAGIPSGDDSGPVSQKEDLGEQIVDPGFDAAAAVKYQFQISKYANFQSPTTVSTTKLSTSRTLSTNTTYYWRVRAYTGSKAPTNAANFWTVVTPTKALSLLTPKNNLTSKQPLQPVFTWKAPTAPAVDHYELQVALDNKFTKSPFTETAGATPYALQTVLTANTNYYWRIRAVYTSGQYSLWSAAWIFKTIK